GHLAGDLPLLDARVLTVGPHPSAVQIAGFGADPDAAEMRLVVDVDREPAPHLRPAPPARAPRLVAVATCIDELVADAVGFDPARPAAGLLEVALADAERRGRARTLARAALAVDADCGRERVEQEVHRDVRVAWRHVGPHEVARVRVDVGAEPPLFQRFDALVLHAADVEPDVDHLSLF